MIISNNKKFWGENIEVVTDTDSRWGGMEEGECFLKNNFILNC